MKRETRITMLCRKCGAKVSIAFNKGHKCIRVKPSIKDKKWGL